MHIRVYDSRNKRRGTLVGQTHECWYVHWDGTKYGVPFCPIIKSEAVTSGVVPMNRRAFLEKVGITAAMLALPTTASDFAMAKWTDDKEVNDLLDAILELERALDRKGVPQENRWLFVPPAKRDILLRWNPTFGKGIGLIGGVGLFNVYCWEEIDSNIMYAGQDESDHVHYIEYTGEPNERHVGDLNQEAEELISKAQGYPENLA